MLKALKWFSIALVVLAIVAVAVPIVILSTDQGHEADPNEPPFAGARIVWGLVQRLRVHGGIDIDPGLTTTLVARDVRLANAAWAETPWLARAARVRLSVDWRAIANGDIAIAEFRVERPRVNLLTAADGRHNWDFLAIGDDPPVPIVRSLRIENGTLRFRDLRRDIDMRAHVATATASITGTDRALRIEGRGTIEQVPFTFRGALEALIDIRPAVEPHPFEAELTLGESNQDDSTLRLTGSMIRPLDLYGLEADVRGAGPDMAALMAVLPLAAPLPEWPRWRLAAQVARDGATWSIGDAVLHLGLSQISGEATVKTGGRRPYVRADLHARKIDFVQLVGPATNADAGPLIPTEPIDFAALRAFDSDLRFDGRTVYLPKLSFEHIGLGLALERGLLTVDPLEFRVGGGWIRAHALWIDARREPVEVVMDIELERLGLREALREFDIDAAAFGTVNGRIELRGQGQSAAAIAAAADGSIELIMQDGRLDALLAELLGQEILEIVAAWVGGVGETIPLRCLIADFAATDGIVETTTLVIDTGDIKVVGRGTINLRTQRIDLVLVPLHKDFSLLASQAPVHVVGPLGDISIEVDPGTVIASLVTPFELPDTEDADCRDLARAARQR